MKGLFTKIQTKLTDAAAIAKFTAATLPPVKYVDLYKGQYYNQAAFELMPLPAILFEWRINHIDGLTSINIHIVYEQARTTSSASPNQAEALKYFDYIDTVNELIMETESETTGKLELTNEEPAKEEVIPTVYILSYNCPYTGKKTDAASKWNYTDEDVDPVITGDIVTPL